MIIFNVIKQLLYLLYQHNKITKKICNNLIIPLKLQKFSLMAKK